MHVRPQSAEYPRYTEPAIPSGIRLNNEWNIDGHTPIESLALLLYALHEHSFSLHNAQMQYTMQRQHQLFEKQQDKILNLLEKVVQKQVAVSTHKEESQTGRLIQKGLVAAMSVMAISTSGVFLPALTATVALFNASDALISAISYVQRQRGAKSDDTLAQMIEQAFTGMLEQYYDTVTQPQLIGYFNSIRTLLSAAVILYRFRNPEIARHLPGYMNLTFEFIGAYHSFQGGCLEAELAALQATQKTEQALQEILHNCLQQLQKDIRKQYVALEDYIRSTSDALHQQSETTRYLIKYA